MTLAFVFDSVGAGEWFVLLAVVLIVMGPKRLPATARQIGAYYSKFRRAADSFKRQLMEMDTEFDRAVDSAAKEAEEAVKLPEDPAMDYGPNYDGGYGYNPDYPDVPSEPTGPDGETYSDSEMPVPETASTEASAAEPTASEPTASDSTASDTAAAQPVADEMPVDVAAVEKTEDGNQPNQKS